MEFDQTPIMERSRDSFAFCYCIPNRFEKHSKHGLGYSRTNWSRSSANDWD